MKNKIMKSFDELEILLPDDERKNARYESEINKQAAQRPWSMQTRYRILPLLPKWMKAKVIEAKELFDNNNTCCGDSTLWNHTLILPLDNKHDITFAIGDSPNGRDYIKETMEIVVEVYKSLQVLCRKYHYPITIVSQYTNDFGMYLPNSFFDDDMDDDLYALRNSNYGVSSNSNLEDIIKSIAAPRYARLSVIEALAKEHAESLKSVKDKVKFNTWFAYQHKEMMDYYNSIGKVLESSKNDYYGEPMWDCIDIYMGESRKWAREFCVKMHIGENPNRLMELDKLRPLIDDIMKMTSDECFAFGIKPRGSKVIPCNHVNAQWD